MAARRCNADISLSVPSPAASPIPTPQKTIPVQARVETSSEKNFVASPSSAYAAPAPPAITSGAGLASRESTYGTSASTPSEMIAAISATPVSCRTSRSGAAQASSPIPTVIAVTLPSSRRPTGSSSSRCPIASSTIKLVASAGSTSVSGIRSSAPTWAAQPQRASSVPRIQRGRLTSRRSSASRRWCSPGARRASKACNPTAAA